MSGDWRGVLGSAIGRRWRSRVAAGFLAGGLAVVAVPGAAAQPPKEGAALAEPAAPVAVEVDSWSWTATAALVSDYRYRGTSFSDRDPVVQGSLQVAHRSGVYAGLGTTTLASYGGSNVEVDAFAGYGTEAAGFTWDIGYLGILFVGSPGQSLNFHEVYGSVSRTIGPVDVTLLSINYAPAQNGLGGQEGVYATTGAAYSLPALPLTVSAKLGFEDGAFGTNKVDWSLALDYAPLPYLSATIEYVDTNKPGRLVGAGPVATLRLTF
ncbi:hypothetical protein CCR85_05025 [Rhodothalassium salexigens]|uniref:TorF family putative porin n=1 Tax=Rhodothalassium salexigens TaxID=1086 RepID=UPI001912484D|nr:TorF family putative porin [Rhodothalassium salexigens]MBK5910855.1 hypothetical protein [Rhodothalassium salexigens]